MRGKTERKGVGVTLLIGLVAALVSIGLIFMATGQLTAEKIKPLENMFLTHVTGSAGGVLHVTTCDYKHSDTDELVFFCWGWRCARLNKLGPDFRKGKTGSYNIAMRDKGIKRFYFVLIQDRPGFLKTITNQFKKASKNVKEEVKRQEEVPRKALAFAVNAFKESRGFPQVFLAQAMNFWKAGTSQCWCIKRWHLDYRGRTIMNVTYENGYVLGLEEGKESSITPPLKPKPNLLTKHVNLTGNLKSKQADNKDVNCKDYPRQDDPLLPDLAD